jgi:hypothetical protein
MSFSVFISYSTRDLANATVLRDWVAAAGAQPFLAEYSLAPGRPLAADILATIKSCDLFLFLWSRGARDSEWVPQEIGVARGAGKPILPVVLEPGLELPGFVKDLKYLDVYRDPTASIQWLYRHLAAQVKEKDTNAVVVVGVIGAVLLLLAAREE